MPSPHSFSRSTLRTPAARCIAALAAPMLAVLLVAGAGCGGAQQQPVDSPPEMPSAAAGATATEKAPEGAEAECLALAGAKREKRPNEPAKISVKHVLIKYAGADRAGEGITRTRGAACLRAIEARDKIRGGADFGQVVKDYSEEPGAASREGSVAAIERAMVVEPFADAAFELDINQLSDVVETAYGFHVILRTE